MANNLGLKILGVALIATGVWHWIKQSQSKEEGLNNNSINDATKLGMPYSIDLTKLVMNPIGKDGGQTPIIPIDRNQLGIAKAIIPTSATVKNGVIQTGIYPTINGTPGTAASAVMMSYEVALKSDGYFLTIPQLKNSYALYSSTDGSFLMLVNDATNVGLPFNIDITKVVANPNYKLGSGVTYPFTYNFNGVDIDVEIDAASKAIVLVVDKVVNYATDNRIEQLEKQDSYAGINYDTDPYAVVDNGDGTYTNYFGEICDIRGKQINAGVINSYSDTDGYYSPIDGSFIKLVFNSVNNLTVISLDQYPAYVDISTMTGNQDGTYSAKDVDPALFTITADGTGAYNLSYKILDNYPGKDIDPTSVVMVNYGLDGNRITYKKADGSRGIIGKDYSPTEDNYPHTLQDAINAGFPESIDIKKFQNGEYADYYSSTSTDGEGNITLTKTDVMSYGETAGSSESLQDTTVMYDRYGRFISMSITDYQSGGYDVYADPVEDPGNSFYNTSNDASVDGMPFALDLPLIKYDSDPLLLPAGSYPTGVYNGIYRVYGSPSGNLTLDGIDAKGEYIGDYTYDPKGIFISKYVGQ